MKYHIIAFFVGFLLDLLLGDPYWLPHPVRLIGRLIAGLEKILRAGGRNGKGIGGPAAEAHMADSRAEEVHTADSRAGNPQAGQAQVTAFQQGIVLVVLVLVSVVAAVLAVLVLSYRVHPYVGMAVEGLMTYQILAVKCLKVESMKVWKCLKDGDLERARAAVSMIVGRDTACLDEEGVAKAAVETVAENTSDGVIAPMLYLAVGGPVLGFFYKAVNTMDSMVGYRNDEYLYFGRAAAKLDDLMNFIPARCSAVLMIITAFFFEWSGGRFAGYFSGRGAVRIYRRDRRKHASPNSAQTESVCAGALGIQLAGDASYFGRIVKKPCIGDPMRKVEYEDIRRADHLLYGTAWLCEMLCLLLLICAYPIGF